MKFCAGPTGLYLDPWILAKEALVIFALGDLRTAEPLRQSIEVFIDDVVEGRNETGGNIRNASLSHLSKEALQVVSL